MRQRLQLAGRLDGGDGKHDGVGRLLAEPHVDDLAAGLGLDVPAGQQRRVDLGDLEPFGNDEAEAIDRAMENPEGHRGVEFLVGLGHLVEEHAARGHGLLAALQVAVQRHEDGRSRRERGSSSKRVTLALAASADSSTLRETTSAPPLISTSPGTVSRQRPTGGVGQAETQGLLGGVHFQRGDHSSSQLVPAFAGDQQVQPPVGRVADRGGLVVELGRQQAHAAKIQGTACRPSSSTSMAIVPCSFARPSSTVMS